MTEIGLLVSCKVGVKVLRNPKMNERISITTNYCHGKNMTIGVCINMDCCTTIVNAIIIPTIMPIRQLARMSTIAS
jgi:hypothetical protein